MEPKLTDEQVWQLFELWEAGASRSEICERFQVSVGSVFDRGRARRSKGHLAHPKLEQLPKRQGRGGGRKPGSGYPLEVCPTPEEIALRCAEIRARKTSRGD
jgi:hypothetical protein